MQGYFSSYEKEENKTANYALKIERTNNKKGKRNRFIEYGYLKTQKNNLRSYFFFTTPSPCGILPLTETLHGLSGKVILSFIQLNPAYFNEEAICVNFRNSNISV
mgnify:CR=1 FL=1